MTVGSNHVISKDDYLIMKMKYDLALSKIEYNYGEGQNPSPYIDGLPPSFPKEKSFPKGAEITRLEHSHLCSLCKRCAHLCKRMPEIAQDDKYMCSNGWEVELEDKSAVRGLRMRTAARRRPRASLW
jgi:hypothetical protein